MPLIIRTFRSRQGQEGELIQCLRRAGSGMVRYLQAESVVICRQTNDPEQFFWIGDRGGESDFIRLPLWDDLAESFERSLLMSSPALSFGFLDEFYRFPSPPYEVWSLEVHAPREGHVDTLKDLFDLSRVARQDPHVVGMSLYRAAEDLGAFVGFLGLARGFTPSRLVRNGAGPLRMTEVVEAALTWRPLTVAWEAQRLPAGERAGAGERAPFAPFPPFWVRTGAVSTGSTTPGDAREPGIGAQDASGRRVADVGINVSGPAKGS